MDLVKYVEQEIWCSFKNNNRTLFERSLWILGANKYKNKVIKNLITEDITIYYPNNFRQLRGFNANQPPLSDETLKSLNFDDLNSFIEDYYTLKDKLYSFGELFIIEVKNNNFDSFKKYYKKFILIHAKIFAYEYLISSLGQALSDRLSDNNLKVFSIWKNKGQMNGHKYFITSFEFIKNYFDIDLDIKTLTLYTHVEEVLRLLNGKLTVNTLKKRIMKRQYGFVLTNLQVKKYYNKVITNQIIIKKVRNRLECLENANYINANMVKGKSTYENNLVISGKVVVIDNNHEHMDIFNKIVVCSITTPNDVYRYIDAKALVVDYGGMLSHAAIFSREIHKPCLIGTEVGTKIFKTGDIIEIDFRKEIAYKI